MSPREVRFLGIGAASGLLSAGSTMVQLGDVGAPDLFGACLGFSVGGYCRGIDLSFYLFPGLVFGILFAGAQLAYRRMDFARSAAFVLASGIANAIAVFICVTMFNLIGEAVNLDILDLPLAIAGAIAGAAGGALLGGAVRRLFPGSHAHWPIAAASALGLLTPVMPEIDVVGVFIFYIAWQGIYAAVLAASLPAGA
jgi:hypothetical protein